MTIRQTLSRQHAGSGHKTAQDARFNCMTLIHQTPDNAPWEAVARSVFWSRDVGLSTWREQVLAGHRSYLPDSVARMSTRNFIRFLGRANFRQHWPRVRALLSPSGNGVARLDAAWSLIESGTFNLAPESALLPWPGRSREVYNAIVHHQGASIYETAAIAGVPYRRVHDHVRALEKLALVKSFIDTTGPRPRRRLYTMRSAPRSPLQGGSAAIHPART